ncbi:hypothetical protein [Lunatibacter salilacus]|uniref:hypothetical protein n=1 Tax=Lunatibacter salilacus TaxID=2483804 RepID=UPI00131AF695|nr:hypothetical protein [Lunatibacter salilacus]
MQTAVFPGDDMLLMENLIHHRLNLRVDVDDKWSFHAGLRNRIFAGNLTGMNENFGQQLDAISDDWIPLSVLWVERSQYAIHSTLDRFYTEWNHKNWNIRAGRQRVNWGQNIAFNPNDLFNVYNFLDFDYEERPGTDAIRVQYYTGFASGLDLVVKGGKDRESIGLGGRWFFNRNEYDMQLIGGLTNGDIAIGGGWSGYLKDIGWKGELTWFHPLWDQDKKQAISASTGIDHSLGKGWFMYLSYLFNSDVPEGNLLLLDPNRVLTARTIFPFKHSLLTQISYPITPLVSASGAFIYSINENHPLILNPSLQLNLAENWDIDIIGQVFRPMAKDSELSPVGLWFLRVRWSY